MMAPSSPGTWAVGQALPALAVTLGTSDIVAMSLATRDFHPVHHDPAVAHALGHPALFLNIMGTSALVERFVRAGCGPAVRLTSLRLKLGVPHHAGDTLTFTGEVLATGRDAAGPWAEIGYTGSNARGRHASGQVRVGWPGDPGPAAGTPNGR